MTEILHVQLISLQHQVWKSHSRGKVKLVVNLLCGLVSDRRFPPAACQMDVTWKCHVRALYPRIWCMVLWSCPVGDIQFWKATLLWPVERGGNEL